MDFGIGLQWGDWRHMASSSTLVEVARNARELGFASLWATDRLTARSGPPASSEALVTLASLIHAVPDMQLGVAVLVLPLRNAVVLAKQAATLSLLSGGRFLLGVGAGWHKPDFNLVGADYMSRGRKTDESIEVMRQLWREDEATYHGEFYRFEDAVMRPRPPGKRVPLWIGGNSRTAIRRAARVGDGWVPSGLDPQTLREGVTQLRELSAGRTTPTVAAMLFVDARLAGDDEKAAKSPISGTAEHMVATLQAYQEAGLEHLISVFASDGLSDLAGQMRTFSEKVMPHFTA
jgi:probable F420-dependent oxidoreductase